MVDLVVSIFEYSMGCAIAISVIAVFILGVRKLWGDKLSKRFIYGVWIAIPVFMLISPWVKLPVPEFAHNLFTTVKNSIVEVDNNDGELDEQKKPIWDKVVGNNESNKDMAGGSGDKVVEDNGLNKEPVSDNNIKDSVSDKVDNVTNAPGMENDTNVSTDNAQGTGDFDKGEHVKNDAENIVEGKTAMNVKEIVACVYVAIVLLLFVALFGVNIRFGVQCRQSREYVCSSPDIGLVVYKLKEITSPFLMGRNIYIPHYVIDDEELRYAILHEQCHYRHGDGLWIIVRYVVLVLNFYNPIMWLANKYVGRDCELACDEAVLERLEEFEGKKYGSCLLNTIEKSRSISQSAVLVTNMKSEKKLMRERIENIVTNNKKSIVAALATIVLVVIIAVCALMDGGVLNKKIAHFKPHTIGNFKVFNAMDETYGDINEYTFECHSRITMAKLIEESYRMKCDASSVLKTKEFNVYKKYVGDLDRSTAWAEGVDGHGLGEYVQMELGINYPDITGKFAVKELCIVTGNAEDSVKWVENNRAKKLKLYYEDKYVALIELEDTMNPQYIDISSLGIEIENGKSACFKFEILDVYYGMQYDNTYISEIIIDYDDSSVKREDFDKESESESEEEFIEDENGGLWPEATILETTINMHKDWKFGEPEIKKFFNFDAMGGMNPDDNGKRYGFYNANLFHRYNYYCNATASSTLNKNDGGIWDASNLTTGTRDAVWCEGASGDGIGEYVEIKYLYHGYVNKVEFASLCIVNGNAKDSNAWKEYNRVKQLRVYYNDTYVGMINLEDVMGPQHISLKYQNESIMFTGNGQEAKFKFEIASVYKGPKYDATCLTGIAFDVFADEWKVEEEAGGEKVWPPADNSGAEINFSDSWDYKFGKPQIQNFFDYDAIGETRLDDNGKYYVGTLGLLEYYKYYCKVTASSTLEKTGDRNWDASNLITGTRDVAWCEGVNGDGVGEYIEMRHLYHGYSKIGYWSLCVVNGNAKDATAWQEYNRVKSLKVYYDDTYVGMVTLEDTIKPQYISISELDDWPSLIMGNGQEAKFRFEIADVYKGTKYDDTCITGIELLFNSMPG